MTAPIHIGSRTPTETRSSRRAALLAAALLAVGYTPTLLAFPGVWLEFRSHGFLIAAFCLWRIWTQRADFVPCSPNSQMPRLLAAPVSIVWLVALILGLRVVHMTMLPIVALSWVAAVYGPIAMQRLLPVALTFAIALPLWEIFFDVLQAMTVAVSGAVSGIVGISATVNGNQIIFPFGVVEVARSCAGLNFLMSGLTISVIYAQLFLVTRRARTAAIVVGTLLSIFSNWIRVSGLVLIGYYTRMTSPLMASHSTYGWIIFAAVTGVFFLVASRIDRWDRVQSTAVRVGRPPASEIPPVSASAFRANLVWASLAALIGPLVFYSLSLRSGEQPPPAALRGIQPAGAWRSVAVAPATADTGIGAPWRPAYHGASSQQHLGWSDGITQVQVDRLIFTLHNRDGELIGGGNSIAEPRAVLSDRAVGPLDRQLRTVREAIVRTSQGARVVWYWYRVANVDTPSAAKAKLLELVTFVTRGAPSELVAVSAPCAADNCQAAGKALFHFVTGQQMPVQSAP